MGYSVYAVAKNQEAFDAAVNLFSGEIDRFIENQFGPIRFATMQGDPKRTLSYANKKHKLAIGFDYSGGILGHDFAWNYASLLGITIGDVKDFGMGTFPYVVYDGDEFVSLMESKPTTGDPHFSRVINNLGEGEWPSFYLKEPIVVAAIEAEREHLTRIRDALLDISNAT